MLPHRLWRTTDYHVTFLQSIKFILETKTTRVKNGKKEFQF